MEALTDAVRATLGHIAAVRNWPHNTHDDLYSIAAALGSGSEWPNTMEEFDRALEGVSKEGDNLCAALGASMGRPRMLKFGVYAENPDGPRGRRNPVRHHDHRAGQPLGPTGGAMNQEQHLSMARELMRRADQESGDGGNEMIAAEFLWGALAHCLITVAQNEGLPHDSHGTSR